MQLLRFAAPLLLAFFLSACGDLLGSSENDAPPELVSAFPEAGAKSVSVIQPIALHFSRVVNRADVSASLVLRNGLRPVLAEPVVTNKGRTIVLQPVDPLDFGTRYRVEVSGGLTFRGGAELLEAKSWEFDTEGLPPPAPDRDSLMLHLGALAHDSMRGRGSGSADELRAAEYLSGLFVKYGLSAPPGGIIQAFEAFSYRMDRTLTSRNVLGMVEGAGSLADEWVVVGAHYDHIGFRGLESEHLGPNNGADDNGSGTVLMLEMARVFRAYIEAGGTGQRDRRSVLFAAFGAEEEGLLGSCTYVHSTPAVPLARTRVMMNLDMVGRLRGNTLYLSGGETSPIWDPMVRNANYPELQLVLSDSSCTGCTDHVCFWQAGIPFVGFFTGLHAEYHGPGDDVDLVDFPGMVRIGELGLRILNRLTVMPEPPELTGPYPVS